MDASARDKGAALEARETFEQAARAAKRLSVVAAELDSLDESWRRGEWLAVGRGSGHGDPTAASAGYRMGVRKRLEMERAELGEIVAEARALAAGIAELLGTGYADALTLRYVEGRPWQEVADSLGVCERTAYNRVSTALDTIDSMGRANVVMGRGTATN